MGPRDVALAISVPVIWGSGFVLAKVALDGFPAILLMAMRFTVTAAVLIWFFRPPIHLWGKLFLIALISGSVQYSLTFNGLKQIDASTAGLIVQTEVPFAALIAAVFLKEKITVKTIGGLSLALIGVAVIFGEPRIDGQEVAVLMVLGGALTWAIGQVMVRAVGEIGGFTMISGVAIFATPQL